MNKINSLPEYIKAIDEIVSSYEDDVIVYRGENRIFKTSCCPNLFRKNYLTRKKLFEKHVLDEMSANGLTHGKNYLLKAIDAQHGGFPSRLLDVTYNALIALYFAVTPFYTEKEEKDDNEDGVVYIFDFEDAYCALSYEVSEIYNSIVEREGKKELSEYKIFQYNHKFIDHVNSNERIIAQQGAVILFQGNSYTPIPEYMYEKVIINYNSKKVIRKQLKDLFGITTGYIYPEINNKVNYILEKSLKYSEYSFSIENELILIEEFFKKYLEYQIEQIIRERNLNEIIDKIVFIEREIKEYKDAIIEFVYSKEAYKYNEEVNNLCNLYNTELIKFEQKIRSLNNDINLSHEELLIMESIKKRDGGGSENGKKEKNIQWKKSN